MVCCNKIYFNSTFLICLIIIAITTTVNIVIDPPNTILGTKPKNVAAIPLSKAPNSLDELTKIELTDGKQILLSRQDGGRLVVVQMVVCS